MAESKIGPKEAQLRALREELAQTNGGKKPSTSDLRGKIAKIKGGGSKAHRKSGRGR